MTEQWFTRINYWDGDVLDQQYASEALARAAAIEGSRNLKADIDVCHGANVLAVYRAGREI